MEVARCLPRSANTSMLWDRKLAQSSGRGMPALRRVKYLLACSFSDKKKDDRAVSYNRLADTSIS